MNDESAGSARDGVCLFMVPAEQACPMHLPRTYSVSGKGLL